MLDFHLFLYSFCLLIWCNDVKALSALLTVELGVPQVLPLPAPPSWCFRSTNNWPQGQPILAIGFLHSELSTPGGVTHILQLPVFDESCRIGHLKVIYTMIARPGTRLARHIARSGTRISLQHVRHVIPLRPWQRPSRSAFSTTGARRSGKSLNNVLFLCLLTRGLFDGTQLPLAYCGCDVGCFFRLSTGCGATGTTTWAFDGQLGIMMLRHLFLLPVLLTFPDRPRSITRRPSTR